MGMSTVQVVVGLFLFLAVASSAIPYWKICERTGLSKGIVVFIFIPFVSLLVPWIVGFSEWPKLATGPQKGVVYTPSELEDFKRRGLK
jgi:hypothetical protein